jgi:hypothetical protein
MITLLLVMLAYTPELLQRATPLAIVEMAATATLLHLWRTR